MTNPSSTPTDLEALEALVNLWTRRATDTEHLESVLDAGDVIAEKCGFGSPEPGFEAPPAAAFSSGVSIGVAIAAAVIADPLGDPSPAIREAIDSLYDRYLPSWRSESATEARWDAEAAHKLREAYQDTSPSDVERTSAGYVRRSVAVLARSYRHYAHRFEALSDAIGTDARDESPISKEHLAEIIELTRLMGEEIDPGDKTLANAHDRARWAAQMQNGDFVLVDGTCLTAEEAAKREAQLTPA